MNEQLIQRIRNCPTLPSLPTIAVQVLELASRAEVDITEIARIISKDPALSTKILRTVNSSFYGRSQNVSTISHALVILGLQSVKTLVLGFSLVTNLAMKKARGFKHLDYWKHSVFAATAARTIASKVNVIQQEEAFLAALLMDIGMLVLDQVLGDQYSDIHSKINSHSELAAAELSAFGTHHAEVGGMLAEQWNLPPLLAAPIAHHEAPAGLPDLSLRKLTQLVHIASRAADVFVDQAAAAAISYVRDQCAAHFNLSQAETDAMLDDIGKRTREAATLFEINIGSGQDYEGILKKANEALVELTLQSQQQATQLEVQNQQLKQQMATDGLMQLANRAHFEQFFKDAFGQALSSQRPLAILMLDIDRFKSVNDTHGHQSGDAVLKYVGKLLKAAARAGDLPARYGGEEIVLVLPDTARSTAAAIAETIRRAIGARPVSVSASLQIPITASIGVAVLEPGSPFKQVAQLLKAADLAVYNAKHSGRNCVRVFSAPIARPTIAAA